MRVALFFGALVGAILFAFSHIAEGEPWAAPVNAETFEVEGGVVTTAPPAPEMERGTFNYFESSKRQAALSERLEDLRRQNDAYQRELELERKVREAERTRELHVIIDRKIHESRQRTARKGYTTPLPGTE